VIDQAACNKMRLQRPWHEQNGNLQEDEDLGLTVSG
jgi:hypothetical protein